MKVLSLAILSTVVAAAILGGCTKDARDQYSDAGSSADDAAKKTGRAMRTDADETTKMLAKDAANATNSLKDSSARAEVIAANDQTSAKIKSALITATDLHSSGIHVDTNGSIVTLSGEVPTAAEKHRAALIAKQETGSGFTVKNNLTVSGS